MNKRVLLSVFLFVVTITAYAQKNVTEFHQGQARIIEPMQDVFIRPLVADLEIVKQEITEYFPSWELRGMKLSEITYEHLEQAKKNAVQVAASKDGVDMIVAATFEVRNHIDKKGNIVDDGVDIIVRGYPAKYVNWHKMGDQPDDSKWFNSLVEAQHARSAAAAVSSSKTEAIKK